MPTKYVLTLEVELEDGASEMEMEGLVEDLGWRTRIEFQGYKELATELAGRAATEAQVETFLKAFLPMPDLAADVQYSKRVEKNVLEARESVRAVLAGPTTPEAHRRTAYGLWQAGLEYLQHVRPTRAAHSKLNRSILSEDKAATNLHRLVLSVLK